ncbi:RNA-binding protein [Komarekiella sp. 'clone 1']|uniref:RNA-binding protein n=1 Tax=Komarekiella delphini-convector SJRDD-AB1 TaxID=2593771 RepID=A0AA40SYI9_9NOST|nr:agenet domain-containing protein [Komarekiella delphini-convector]MBD6617320.1 RNA-binding protein [Komarekiella delphini-convector SJRDD-AB1]
MKKNLLFAGIFMATWVGTLIPSAFAASLCSVGQKAEVLWKGRWYPATVLNVDVNKCYITYDGYDSSWNEWVETARFRASFKKGDSVRILWRGKWYQGRVLEVSKKLYKITYDGYDSSWDEWVEPARVSR